MPESVPSSEELLEVAILAARRAGALQQEAFRDQSLEVGEKGRNDFVTEVDRESERRIVETLQRRFPDHAVLGEEGGWVAGYEESAKASGSVRWIVDPLDGTTNFIQGLPYFCVSIACEVEGELEAACILDPIRGDLFSARRGAGAFLGSRRLRIERESGVDGAFLATGFPFRAGESVLDPYLQSFRTLSLRVRGMRRCGAAALDLANTAAGIFDGFWEFRLSAWDVAAGVLLIREAGGVVSDVEGGQNFLETGDILAGAPAVHRDLLEVMAAPVLV
ncbi:MAG: inositol monophosphatase family protein [Acidobacteriota bacterium]